MKKLLSTALISGTVLSTLMVSSWTYAEKYPRHTKEHIDFAKVVNVEPIYETVSYSEPYQECHYERRTVKNHKSHTAVIVGSLIGGAIGNELGHNKSNKRVGAIAGAILGGSIANDINRNNRHHYHNTRDERVCTTSQHVSYKEEITGYNVGYKYRGRTYYTTMDQHPGKKIRVAVNIRPVY